MERTLITVPNAISMVAVVGPHDDNLRVIEAAFPSVNITVRGNEITLRGPHVDCARLENLFNEMMVVIRSGNILNVDAVNRAIEMLEHEPVDHPAEVMSLNIVSNRGRTIRPKTANQKRYVDAIEDHTITFGIGPAGTGKTYLAMAMAVAALQAKKVNKIVLTRPAVEAGESLGFLPGTLSEKIDPYLRPLFDALHDMIDIDSIPRLMQSGIIEVAPLAYMRGRTLNDAFVILDEAQNTTPEQMKMFLTRLGFGSKMVVTGDVTQIDLPNGQNSGLKIVRDILKDIDDIAFLELTAEDVVRHRLIGDIVKAYDKFDVARQELRQIRQQ
jgi:phosphate starvation-inducible PhoH-like protein